jgi:hypothetical protein
MPPPDTAENMTQRAEQVSGQIHLLLAGLGPATQGAILADLVSLWLAGQFDTEELATVRLGGDMPRTREHRTKTFDDWCRLVVELIPASEQQLMAQVTPKGHA